MMNKKFLTYFAWATVLSLTSCGALNRFEMLDSDSHLSAVKDNKNSTSISEQFDVEDGFPSELNEEHIIASEDIDTEVGGSDYRICTAHTFSFHSICAPLMRYVGYEEANSWAKSVEEGICDPHHLNGEDLSIFAFLQKFDIPKETFTELTRSYMTDSYLAAVEMTREECYEEFGYTDEQIDALYSGDQDRINRAFCGPLAFVNDADQKVYSIYWLAEHTAEDYIAAKLPLDRVAVILETAALPEFDERYDLIEKIEPQLERARELEKAAAAK